MTVKRADAGDSPWGRRVGVAAARWLVSAERLRLGSIVAAGCAVLAVGGAVPLYGSGGQSPGFVLVVTLAVLAAVTAWALLRTSTVLRWLALDEAFDVLQHRIPGLTGEQLRRSLGSVREFDARLAPRLLESASAPSDIPWIAGAPRPILRGPSQRMLRTVGIAVLLVGMSGALVLMIIGATGRFPPLPLWGSLWSVVGGILALGLLFRVAAAVRRVQEFRAGYSTVWAVLATRGAALGFDVRRCVDLVDPRSGMLLRAAGQRPISWGVYRNRRYQVRQ